MKTLSYRMKVVACIFFVGTLLLMTGCKKDKITNDNPLTTIDTDTTAVDTDDCIPILPPTGQTQGDNYISDLDNYYRAPFFNPDNENEFLYLKRHAYQSFGLYTYNLLTNEKQLIYTGDIWYAPKWGQNGWIIFSKSDGNVYKIKGDGSGLVQLSNEGCYHYPDWYFDQDKFVTYSTCIEADILFDANGIPLDTLPKRIGTTGSLTRAPYIAMNGGNGVRFYNYQTNNFDFVYDYSSQVNSASSGSIFWTSTSEVIYSNTEGLNRLTIPSLTNINFKPSCNAKLYLFGSINSSKTKMIWNRIDRKRLNNSTIYSESKIYIMNIDGSDETEINFE